MLTKFFFFSFSKFDDSGDVLVDEALVVGLQGLDVRDLGAFRVKVENTEKMFPKLKFFELSIATKIVKSTSLINLLFDSCGCL
jgi:hypothetical protein